MSNQLARIADRVINRPLMILPDKLAMISSVLEGRIGIDASNLKLTGEDAERLSQSSDRHQAVGTREKDANGRLKPYRQTADGTAVISVVGSLVNRGSFLDALSGIESYDRIKEQLRAAVDDPDISSIVLDIDSPGGEAVGAFETGAAVAAANSQKAVVAVANGLCCSAAYAIAAGASRIVASQSALIGSIGVVMLHLDHSHRLHEAGIVPTLIHAGARKVDGTPYKPMTADVADELKSEVNAFMDLFVEGVAKGRPGLTPEAIRATEARVYLGAKAVEAGLADEVGSFEGVIASFNRPGLKSRPRNATGARTMKTDTEDKTISQEDHDKAVKSAREAGHAEGVKAGTEAGIKSERERFSAILNSDDGKKRPKQSLALALTGASVEQAGSMLAVAPEETAVSAATPPDGRGKDAPGGLAQVDSAPKTGADGKTVDGASLSAFEQGQQMARDAGIALK